jgi:hypothetical protein
VTPDQLSAIRARLDAATPGPWEAGTASCCPDMGWVDGPKGAVCPQFTATKVTHSLDANDAELIANAPTDLRALLDEVERLKNDLAMARQVSGELCEACGWAMKFPGEPCRCELVKWRDEWEAFKARMTEQDASSFRRGAEAMREAAAKVCDTMRSAARTDDYAWVGCREACAEDIRALPLPEDK